MSGELLRTSLHAKHLAMEAKLADVAGWEMPLSYRGILDEVAQVRNRAGVFDISHFGRLRVRGDDALKLLERVCTHDVARQEDDTAALTLVCNDAGGIMDDCLLARLEDGWLLTTNPVNRLKVLEHLAGMSEHLDVRIDDQTAKTAHLAVTGPKAAEILDAVLPEEVSSLPPGAARTGSMMLARYVAIRASFTGEWGLEVIVPSMFAGLAWDYITGKAGPSAVEPAGLAARDVLRLEAGLAAYGHELNETIDPITAGLERCVDFSHDFVGRSAVERIGVRGAARRRVGLEFPLSPEGTRPIPRQGTTLARPGGAEVGTVTSGTFSPTVQAVIAMAYVSKDVETGQELLADVAGQPASGRVVDLPFYRPPG